MLNITYEKMVENLKTELERTEILLKAWGNVEILHKKDGGEYKNLTKNCVKGATIYKSFSDMTKIFVSARMENGTHVSDEVTANDFKKDGHPLKTPEQVRESIEKHVEWLQEHRAAVVKELEDSRQVYDEIDDAVKCLANAIKNAPDNIYNTISEYIPKISSLRYRK